MKPTKEIQDLADKLGLSIQMGFIEHPETGEYIPFDDFKDYCYINNIKL